MEHKVTPNFFALIPFVIFVIFYAGLSIWAQDFYKVPMPIAFLLASATAFFLNKKASINEKIDVYVAGMGDKNIMLMCLIFILAGSFAAVAKAMGSVDAAVVITRSLIPDQFMLAGIFIVSALISLAIGTSCGTIAALTPIAVGLTSPMGIKPEMMLGSVIGGAMFGDNLSMISDTTIAATRSLNVAMKDKFLVNFKMVLPAAIIVVLIYLFLGKSGSPTIVKTSFTWKHILLVVPYILVLVSALLGVNVIALLFLGVLFSSVLGIAMGSFDLWGALNACGKGTLGMAETLIVAILAGGFLNLIRWNGGIEYLLVKINNFIKGKSGCEVGVFLLVSVVNLFTANNTVAIVIAGPIAKDLSDRFQCENRRIASILDTASCFVQGLIPYGAQILIAVGVAKTAGLVVSTPSLLATQYYQYFMMLAVVFSFILRYKKNEVK